jgi:hypothetical protein
MYLKYSGTNGTWDLLNGHFQTALFAGGGFTLAAGGCWRLISIWRWLLGAGFKIWRRMLGAVLLMVADVGRGFQYGGGCGWRAGLSSEADNGGEQRRQMFGADLLMEADVRGRFQYGGGCWGLVSIWRWMSEVDFIMEADLVFMVVADCLFSYKQIPLLCAVVLKEGKVYIGLFNKWVCICALSFIIPTEC